MHDRIYQGDDGAWYYKTRGNHNVGPFKSYHDAEQSLFVQIRGWAKRAKPKKAAWHKRGWQPGRLMRRSVTRQT